MNILIVEDNLIIAENIKEALEEYDFTVFDIATCFVEAINILKKEQVDIALLDINLNGVDEGISIGQYIQQNFQIPFIYTTAFSDIETIEKAKKTLPHTYLVKPINTATLFATIQMAFNNFINNKKASINHLDSENSIPKLSIKEKGKIEQINWEDIFLLTAYKNYVGVKTIEKEYLLRSSLSNFIEHILPKKIKSNFIQINRNQAINLKTKFKFDGSYIYLNNKSIKIGQGFKQNLKNKLIV